MEFPPLFDAWIIIRYYCDEWLCRKLSLHFCLVQVRRLLQTIYASKYTSNKAKGIVNWSPVKNEGNALVSGSWVIRDNKKSTNLVLKINSDLEIPLPSLMKMVVTPIVQGEFEKMVEKMVEKYIDNLTQKFGGEVQFKRSFD